MLMRRITLDIRRISVKIANSVSKNEGGDHMDYTPLAREYLEHLADVNKTAAMARQLRRAGDVMCGELFVMLLMRRCGGSVYPGHISREAQISTARVAALLNSLEKKGFISRSPSENDRRMSVVSLTEDGRAYADEKSVEIIGRHAAALRSLGERDAKELVRLLGRLAENEKMLLRREMGDGEI